MSRTVSEPSAVKRSGTMRQFSLSELRGRSGRERFMERKKERILVEYAYCARCNDGVSGPGAQAFATHHSIKHAPKQLQPTLRGAA